MKIVTKTGDKGTTALWSGERVSKADLRVEAYGTLDELTSFIGLAIALGVPAELTAELEDLQKMLFYAAADLAKGSKVLDEAMLSQAMVERLEKYAASRQQEIPEQKRFLLPGGTSGAAALHTARTVCRRAERLMVALNEQQPLAPALLVFINRLSDYLFMAARLANLQAKKKEFFI